MMVNNEKDNSNLKKLIENQKANKKKVLRVQELENGKVYRATINDVNIRVGIHNGNLVDERDRILNKELPLNELLKLEFEYVEEQEFNPYAEETVIGHYWITDRGDVEEIKQAPISSEEYEYGNCYNDKGFAEWKAKEIKLLNNLERFSYENSGSEIDWNDTTQGKFHIIPDVHFRRHSIYRVSTYRQIGQIYFISRKVAEKALEKYRDLIEEVYFQDKH